MQIIHLFCSHPLKLKSYKNPNFQHTSEIIYFKICSLPSRGAPCPRCPGWSPSSPLPRDGMWKRQVSDINDNKPLLDWQHCHWTIVRTHPTPLHPTHPQFHLGHERVRGRSILTVRRGLYPTAPLPGRSPNYLIKYNSDSVNIWSEILVPLTVPYLNGMKRTGLSGRTGSQANQQR